MRVADRNDWNTAYRSQAKGCDAPKCNETTREGKPYCPRHVGLNFYAHEVMEMISRRNAEDALVLHEDTSPKDYNTDGVTARSIVQHLRDHGTRTKERICRELNIERVVLDGYVDAMLMEERVRLGITSRGCETVALQRPA